jgi:iron complex transport system substrate-binding protein
MFGRSLIACLLLWSVAAQAADVVDATGRTVQIPDRIAHVLPAGPPAAVLLAALAPDLMMGWPDPISDDTRTMLAPAAAGGGDVPRLTGHDDVTDKIKALKPDLIVDYGTVSPRYTDLDKATQQKTGIPTILLDGSMTEIPHALRTLGTILHREDRAETLARFAEAILGLPKLQGKLPSVVYARGADGLNVAAPGTDITEVFTRLGLHVLAPDGQGTFRAASIDAIRKLDPDGAWRVVRAVREGHAFVSPSLPFGWIEEPPSINRLLGFAWLNGSDPGILAAIFNAVVYGRVLTPLQSDTVLAGFRPLPP